MRVAFKKQPKRHGVPLWVYFFIFTVVSSALAFSTDIPEKKYKVEFTIGDWEKYNQWINATKQALVRSDLPARDVSTINDSLSKFQRELSLQITPQLDAEKKLEKPPLKNDSTLKKTN